MFLIIDTINTLCPLHALFIIYSFLAMHAADKSAFLAASWVLAMRHRSNEHLRG